MVSVGSSEHQGARAPPDDVKNVNDNSDWRRLQVCPRRATCVTQRCPLASRCVEAHLLAGVLIRGTLVYLRSSPVVTILATMERGLGIFVLITVRQAARAFEVAIFRAGIVV